MNVTTASIDTEALMMVGDAPEEVEDVDPETLALVNTILASSGINTQTDYKHLKKAFSKYNLQLFEDDVGDIEIDKQNIVDELLDYVERMRTEDMQLAREMVHDLLEKLKLLGLDDNPHTAHYEPNQLSKLIKSFSDKKLIKHIPFKHTDYSSKPSPSGKY